MMIKEEKKILVDVMMKSPGLRAKLYNDDFKKDYENRISNMKVCEQPDSGIS